MTRTKEFEDALKELLYFAYTYEDDSTAIQVVATRPALITVNLFKWAVNKEGRNDWQRISSENILTREPDWSIEGVIKPSTPAHVLSVLARAKEILYQMGECVASNQETEAVGDG